VHARIIVAVLFAPVGILLFGAPASTGTAVVSGIRNVWTSRGLGCGSRASWNSQPGRIALQGDGFPSPCYYKSFSSPSKGMVVRVRQSARTGAGPAGRLSRGKR
jgi:hypothetical protein